MNDVQERSCLRVSGVLLDVDGTLLDSNDAHAESWVEALAEAGLDSRFENVRPLTKATAPPLFS